MLLRSFKHVDNVCEFIFTMRAIKMSTETVQSCRMPYSAVLLSNESKETKCTKEVGTTTQIRTNN